MAGCLELPSSLKRPSLFFSLIPEQRCLRVPDQPDVYLFVVRRPRQGPEDVCQRVAENERASDERTMGARG